MTLVCFVCFVIQEQRAKNPVFALPLILNRNIGPSLLATMLLGVCIFGLDTYVPLYVQGGRNGTVTAAAGVVTPVMFTWALSGMVAAPLIVRWGFRKTAMCGGVPGDSSASPANCSAPGSIIQIGCVDRPCSRSRASDSAPRR